MSGSLSLCYVSSGKLASCEQYKYPCFPALFILLQATQHNSTTSRYQKGSTTNTSSKKLITFHPNHFIMPRSMAMILTTAFITVTALTHYNAPTLTTYTVTLTPAPTAPPGVRPGVDFDDGLVFKPYKGVDCHGEPANVFKGQYGYWEVFQMQSYSLSRALRPAENLDFYSGIGTDGNVNFTVDNSLNRQSSSTCMKFDRRAGVNATTSDTGNDPKFHGRNQGCHTLVHNEWCANIWNNGE